jgi:hypothetical protein
LDLEEVAANRMSRSSGVRTVTTCSAPLTGFPVAASMSLNATLTGVSSPHSTSSARSAPHIAASNPACSSSAETRSSARATNPAATGT